MIWMVMGVALAQGPTLQTVQARAWSRQPVSSVAEGLESEDGAVRRETLRLLGQMRADVDALVVPHVDDPELGDAAVEALALSTTDGSEALLRTWTRWTANAPAHDRHLMVLDGLGRRGTGSVVSLLSGVLQAPPSASTNAERAMNERIQAAYALGRLGRRNVKGAGSGVGALVRCVTTQAVAPARACAWALSRIGLADADPEDVKRLRSHAGQITDPVGQAWSVRALGTTGENVDWAYKSSHREVVVAAYTGAEVSEAQVQVGLKSLDPWVRGQAVMAASSLPEENANSALRPRLERANGADGSSIASSLLAAGAVPTTADMADPRGPVRSAWISGAPVERLPSLLPPPADPSDGDGPRVATSQDWTALGVAAGVLDPERVTALAKLPGAMAFARRLLKNGRPGTEAAGLMLLGALNPRLLSAELDARTSADSNEASRSAIEAFGVLLDRGAHVSVVVQALTQCAKVTNSRDATQIYRVLAKHGHAPSTQERAAQSSWKPLTAAAATSIILHTNRGAITIALESDIAPQTVASVLTMAREGRYENTPVHRVVPAFVAQGGDPTGTGWGGPEWWVPDEDSLRPFDLGAVGMAKAGADTGGSQWFITTVEQPHLTGDYTRFGHVIDGMDIAKTLTAGDVLERVEVK
ncbi:MAG: peptidylprolyl isomerase [Myxococcota bacterium]